MSGFDAGDAVPKLEWDFTKYVPDAKGVSPEPSNEALLEFNLSMRSLSDAQYRSKTSMIKLRVERDKTMTEAEKLAEAEKWAALDMDSGALVALEEMRQIVPPDEAERMHRRQAELVAKLLQDCPTADQIMALPGRVRAGYFGWIHGQLMDPEFGAAGTK